MKRINFKTEYCIMALFSLTLFGFSLSSAAYAAAPIKAMVKPAKAKNVILFIGDGMGLSTVTAARIYDGQSRGETGEENLLSFEKLPNTALVKTYNTNAQVPDSAGTATAMNTGVKTRAGAINIGPSAPLGNCAAGLANQLPTLAEAAHDKGMAVGVVTTTRITHATPATVYGKSPNRNWEADSNIPESQRAFGCTDLAKQLVEFPFTVALGGGSAQFYGKNKGGKRLDPAADLPGKWAKRTGGHFVSTGTAMKAVPNDSKPLLGLFNKDHLRYSLDRTVDDLEPSLTDMTLKAIDRMKDNPKGYYLMVEAGRIDHAHHEGKAGYALADTQELSRAVQAALDAVDLSETLILVTADHSHVFTMAGYPTRGNPILGLVVGNDEHGHAEETPELAKDGLPYTTLGYANGPGAISGARTMPDTGINAKQQATIALYSETHGGEDVPLYAAGPGSSDVRGVIEQNVIFTFMMRSLGLMP